MVWALAVGIAFLARSSPQGYFKQVVTHPTGKNGFEEMVLAGDLLRQGRFSNWLRLSEVADNQVEESKLDPYEAPIWLSLKGTSLLARRRLIVSKFAAALDLIDRASQKDIYDPRVMDFNTLLPEQSGFKEIAKLIPLAVYVAFADGQSQRGATLLAEGFDVYDRLSHGLLIQLLVGIASESILINNIEEMLPRFSQKDAAKLETALEGLLAREPAVRKAMSVELAIIPPLVRKVLTEMKPDDVDMLIGFAETYDREKAVKMLTGMTTAERARTSDTVLSRIADVQRDVRTAFAGSEADWAAYKPLELPPGKLSSPADLVDTMVGGILPAYSQVGRAASVSRTRLRLVSLACGVVKYRWEHGQLPARLDDAVGKDRAVDPLAQGPFEFKRDGAGGFSIVSKGTKDTGEIGLRYKRPESGDPTPP